MKGTYITFMTLTFSFYIFLHHILTFYIIYKEQDHLVLSYFLELDNIVNTCEVFNPLKRKDIDNIIEDARAAYMGK